MNDIPLHDPVPLRPLSAALRSVPTGAPPAGVRRFGPVRRRVKASPDQALGRLVVALHRATGVEDTADVSARILRECFAADELRIGVVTPDRRTVRVVATASGRHPTAADPVVGPVLPAHRPRVRIDDPGPLARTARTGRALITSPAEDDVAAQTVGAIAVLPLTVDGLSPHPSHVLGSLALDWHAAHVVGIAERVALQAAASLVALALHRALLATERRHTAEVLADTLLPTELPRMDGIDLASVYRPLDDGSPLGGDWYDAFALPDGRLYLVIGDVAGHGTSAARTMGKIRFSARAYAVSGLGPAEVLERTNTLLRHHGPDLLASMLCVLYDPRTRRAQVADAGHPPALLVPRTGSARFLEGPVGPMLGAVDAATYPTVEHQIPADAALLLYTDGLVERRDVPIGEELLDLADAAGQLRRFGMPPARLATALADRRVDADLVGDDVCVLAAVHLAAAGMRATAS